MIYHLPIILRKKNINLLVYLVGMVLRISCSVHSEKAEREMMSASKREPWNNWLRQERIRRNWRQQDLADHLGTTILTVQRWEQGRHYPSAYFRIKLCALFAVSAEELGFVPDQVPSPPTEEILSHPSVETVGMSQEATSALDVPGDTASESPFLDSAHLSQERELLASPSFWRMVYRRRVVLGLAGLGLTAVTASSFWLASQASISAPRKPSSSLPVPPQHRSSQLFDPNNSNFINHLAWSPDESLLAVAVGAKVVTIWNIAKEAIALAYPTLNAWVNDVSWSRTNWIAAATAELHAGSIQVWKFPEKTPVFTFTRDYALRSVCWSPNGQYLAFSGHTPIVEVWDPFTSRQISQYTDTTLGLLGMTRIKWSPSGRWLACAADDGTAQVWEALADKPKPMMIYRGHQESVHDLAWSPDERAIVSCSTDRTCRVWEVASGRTRVVYRGHTGEVEGVNWSPRGTFIASASADRTAQVWIPSTGQRVALYGGHSSIVETAHWSADETKLALGTEQEGIEIWQAP